MNARSVSIGCTLLALATGACTNRPEEPPAASHTGGEDPAEGTDSVANGVKQEARSATATFEAVNEGELEGEANLIETDDGVQMTAVVQSASSGTYGIRLDDSNDCSQLVGPRQAEIPSAGVPEGQPDAQSGEHSGQGRPEVASLIVDEQGHGQLAVIVPGANLQPGAPMSLLDKTLVVHRLNDAAAGASAESWQEPIACAVIEQH